jgi:hypothetical protein
VSSLEDRHAIGEALIAYTRAVDSGDWARLDDVFTPGAHIDYTASGGIAGSFPEVKAWLAEVLVLFPRRLHLLGQVDIARDEGGADVAAYFHNPMVLAANDQLLEYGGIYHHRFVRTPDGWRSRRLVEEIVWQRAGAVPAE